jgi:hypothetical protein
MAAECPNGSVPWKAIYGEGEFVLRPPLFESQIRAAKAARRVDPVRLEAAARDYARARVAALEEAERRQREMGAAAGGAEAAGAGAGVVAAGPVPSSMVAAAAPVAAAAAPAAAAAADGPPLPAGWASATAPSGKTYYYHTQTQKRVWRRPTAETPTS